MFTGRRKLEILYFPLIYVPTVLKKGSPHAEETVEVLS